MYTAVYECAPLGPTAQRIQFGNLAVEQHRSSIKIQVKIRYIDVG